MNCYMLMLVGLKFDSNYFSNVHKIMKINKYFVKPLHMAISCDTSGDEYYMSNRVFEFTSGSAGKKRLFTVLFICSLRLNKKETEDI